MSEHDTEIDLDQLADYAAGLLDPAEAAAVEHLLATRPAWARTLAALTAAQPLVQAALAELASPPVPDDVAARLTAGLAQPDPGAEVVDLAARRRRRWPRTAAAITAVAAAAAVVVGGVNLVRDQLRTGVSSSSGAAGVGADRNAAAAPGPASGSSAPTVLMTGTDYTAQTLDTLAARARALHQPGPLTPLHGTTGAEGNGLAAGSLQRLQGTDALRTCLDLVAAAHHGTPELVDYARYQGNPAIVVVLTGPGTGELVVVGPDCGLPGSGTDEIYAAPVR